MADTNYKKPQSIIFDIVVHILLAVLMGIVVAIVANYFVNFAELAIQARNDFTGI